MLSVTAQRSAQARQRLGRPATSGATCSALARGSLMHCKARMLRQHEVCKQSASQAMAVNYANAGDAPYLMPATQVSHRLQATAPRELMQLYS